jgi:hypothetical protein
LPFPSRVFEILVCAMAPALKQNTTPAVRTTFVIAFIPKVTDRAMIIIHPRDQKRIPVAINHLFLTAAERKLPQQNRGFKIEEEFSFLFVTAI